MISVTGSVEVIRVTLCKAFSGRYFYYDCGRDFVTNLANIFKNLRKLEKNPPTHHITPMKKTIEEITRSQPRKKNYILPIYKLD